MKKYIQKGLLESPNLPPFTKCVTYKICMYGKEAVGKTSIVNFLTENKCHHEAYRPTDGVQITHMYQPWKESRNEDVLMQLKYWDAGFNSCKKYPHLLEDCLHEADAVIYVFSLSDKNSFLGLQQEISALLESGFEVPPIILLIANKSDDVSRIVISQNQIETLLLESKYTFFRLSSTDGEAEESADIIKCLCASLWKRDQIIIQTRNIVN